MILGFTRNKRQARAQIILCRDREKARPHEACTCGTKWGRGKGYLVLERSIEKNLRLGAENRLETQGGVVINEQRESK